MPRRVRHVHARPGEWVRVHRSRPRRPEQVVDYSRFFGWVIFILVVLSVLKGC